MMTNLSSRIVEDTTIYLEDIKLKLAYRISLLFLIVFISLTYAYYFDSIESFLTMSLGVIISASSLIILKLTRNYTFVFYTYSICGVLVTSFALITFHETVHLADLLWMLAAVSLAYFGIGKMLGTILLIFSMCAVSVFILLSLNIHIETVKPRSTYQLITLILEIFAGFGINAYLIFIFLDFHKFSEKKLLAANNELLAQNKVIQERDEEKTVLVKEVHHRVKNNLQIIISLLKTQSIELNDPLVEPHFQESINRIHVMSHIHKKLYQQESLNNVYFEEYVRDLANDLISIYSNKIPVKFHINSTTHSVGLRSMVPLGLLFNELITNSLKYAFKNRDEGEIEVSLTQNGETYTLEYKDNGNWINREEYKGFGLSLIDTLTEQLDGNKTLHTSENVTRYHFELKNLDK